MFDEVFTTFYQVGDYVILDEGQGWIIELLGNNYYNVALDSSKLIKVNELDIEVRDNSKFIEQEEVKELLDIYFGDESLALYEQDSADAEALYWDSVVRP
jgi:hypothetical protein